ncbi:MAG: transposase, partial [Comamonas sp.]|nr:transposase [Comamonas sp.]
NRKTQAKFECVQCGHAENADVVGAINVLERGHRLLARGEDVSHAKPKTERLKAKRAASVKQEPAEVSQAQA